MNDADRWKHVKQVFDAALERPPEDRASFVRAQCGHDEALKAEIESLLLAHEGAGSFLARPAIDAVTAHASDVGISEARNLSLRSGDRLGPYEVTGFLGAGGMGEVYRARDSMLERDVAVKVLPDLFLTDPERRVRFEREARLLATLNHPNIATVHGIAERAEHGRHLRGLVMELVDGETLAERLAGPDIGEGMPLGEALDIARQVAAALEAAHEKGIIHRDLKPGNIKVTSRGIVKVLDFGLAVVAATTSRSVTATHEALLHTAPGVLIGTLPYMSPEQARCKPVDARADVWAFGCLLYELLTGRSPFAGDTASDTLARILERDPDWSALPRQAPKSVRDLLQGCLAKNADGRIGSMTAVRTTIEDTLAEQQWVRTSQRRWRSRRRWRVGAVLAAAALVISGVALYRPSLSGEIRVPRLSRPTQVTAAIDVEDYPTWSPDGRTLAYESRQTNNWDIWVTQPGADTAANRTAEHRGDDRYPVWSPDGRQIAFWSSRDGGGYFVMPAVGGTAVKLAATPGTGASYHSPPAWSAAGVELAYVNYRQIGVAFEAFLEIASTVTRETKRLPLPGLQEVRLDLSWSPDGRLIAYVDAAQPTAETTQLRVLRLTDGHLVEITDTRANVRSPRWAPDGRALYFVSNRAGASDLWWQQINADGNPAGPPQQVTTGLEVMNAGLLATGTRLAYAKGRWVSNVWRVPLHADRPATWAEAEQITFEQAFIEMLDISRDGRRIVFSSDRSGNQDIWAMRVGSSEATRLTNDPSPEWAPAFSHDEQEIAFHSNRTGDREIWVIPAGTDGGPARQLTFSKGLDAGPDWSPNGRDIAFRSERLGSSDIWVMRADGSEPRVVAPDPAADYSPDYSPDGQWLAFSSTRGGAPQIWLVPPTGGAEVPLAPGFGSPTWSRDGSQVFFFRDVGGARDIWSVSLQHRQPRARTNLRGRRGTLGSLGMATDGRYLYFTWRDDVGDLWAADISH